jgi:hypothetical protein
MRVLAPVHARRIDAPASRCMLVLAAMFVVVAAARTVRVIVRLRTRRIDAPRRAMNVAVLAVCMAAMSVPVRACARFVVDMFRVAEPVSRLGGFGHCNLLIS